MKREYVYPDSIPNSWYNVKADLPFKIDPPLDPSTKKPLDPSKLLVMFPRPLIDQEISDERFIKIPEEVMKEYSVFRPTPLLRGEISGGVPADTRENILQVRGSQSDG